MNTLSYLTRWGGFAGLVAGAMYALTVLLRPLTPQEAASPSLIDYLVVSVFMVACMGTLLTVAGLHALQRRRYGRLGVGGSSIALAGYALLSVGVTALPTATDDVLGVRILLTPLAILAVLVGSALLGTATIRARILPPWCGVLLIVGFPLAVASEIAVWSTGGIVLGGLWASVGYALLSEANASDHRSSGVA